MTLPALTEYRQSLLRAFKDRCPRVVLHELQMPDDSTLGWSEHTADLGTAFHEFMRRYLETLEEAQQGLPVDEMPRQIPTQEAVEIMYELLAELPFSIPWFADDEFRGMVLGWCDHKWPAPLRKLALEEELRVDIPCPDGEVRTLKGTPDIVLGDPPAGLLIIDGKSGKGRPRGPRTEPESGEIVEKREYLSSLFQGDSYSYLSLVRYQWADYAVFREIHARSGQVRQGRLTREQMEHVERKLALSMMNIDRAISEGADSKLWRPRPGKHCAKQCPVARSCPIPEEMRGAGAIESPERADEVARLYVVSNAQYTQAAEQLKVWEEAGNRPGRADDAVEVRWGPDAEAFRTKGNGRKFGLWPRRDLVEVETTEGAA